MPADEKYINELATHAKEQAAKLHKNMQTDQDLRFGRHKITIPPAYEKSTQVIKTSIVQDVLLRVVSTLTTDRPAIVCPPAGPGDEQQRNASLRERWSDASLTTMEAAVQRPTLRMGIDAACAKGMGVWKLTYRPDAWKGMHLTRKVWWNALSNEQRKQYKDEEARTEGWTEYTQNFRKSAPFPFLWQDVDPLCFYPVNGSAGLEETLEISDLPWRPALKALGVKPVRDGLGWRYDKLESGEPFPEDTVPGSPRTVTVTEHRDSSHITYLVDGKLADQVEHGYGETGYFPFAGHSTSSRTPEEAYLSIIEPFRHLIPALDGLLTMKTNWAYLAAWPFMVREDGLDDGVLPSDSGDGEGKAEPQLVTELPTGAILRGVKFMEVPSTGQDMNQLIEILRLMIDRSGLASVMYGSGAGGSSGYMVSQLMTAAQLVYRPILLNAEMALERMLALLWRLVEERVKTEVFVWGSGEAQGKKAWLGLGPKDINNYYAVNVSIKPLLPMDEIARGDAATRWRKERMISWRYALEKYYNISAPEEMMDEVRVEEYMDDPRVKDLILMDAATRAGLIKPAPPPPPAPPMLPGPPPQQIFGPGGNIIGNVPGAGMAPVQPPPMIGATNQFVPPAGMVPGVGMPAIPPMPQGGGMPPERPIVPRRPGGNFPTPEGQM